MIGTKVPAMKSWVRNEWIYLVVELMRVGPDADVSTPLNLTVNKGNK